MSWKSLVSGGVGLLALVAFAAGERVDRNDPSFVTASLLVMGPGDELYSHVGHACFRMECPTYKLDNVFSYEGESASDQIFRFFAGNLKMGMFRSETESYLKLYRESGRGVWQYKLNLPPELKQRLWEELDREVERGVELPYDHVNRGCAQTTLQIMSRAFSSARVDYTPWPDRLEMSRSELFYSCLADYKWTSLFLRMIIGPECEHAASKVSKVTTPSDMIELLCGARINGRPILAEEPVELTPQTLKPWACPVTPMMVAGLLLVLAIVGWVRPIKAIDYALLALLAVMGCFESFVVLVSDLPASSWNWLLIPFNPLPVIFWRWRRHWAIPWVVALVGWEAFMWLSPHRLTDPAFCVLVAAYVVMFARSFVTRLTRKK